MASSTKTDQRGIALLLCLFALMILTAIAMGLMYMGDSETRINDNYRTSLQAYYAAQAGIEDARDRIRTTNSSPITLPTTMAASTGGVVYLLNPAGGSDTVQPWSTSNSYFDDELCHEKFSSLSLTDPGAGAKCTSAPSGSTWYTTATSSAPMANSTGAMSYKWVRVTLKANGGTAPYCVNGSGCSSQGTQVCWNGTQEVLLSGSTTCAGMGAGYFPVYTLTSLAVTSNGGRRMVQSDVRQDKLNLSLPATLNILGPITTSSQFTQPGNGFVVQGQDDTTRCSSGTTNPALGAMGSTNVSNLSSYASPAANYTGTGGSSSTPSISDITTSLQNSGLDTVTGLENLVSSLTSMANTVASDCSSANLGSDSNPQIVVINGTCNISGNPSTPGAGILVVRGTLNYTDHPYNGIMLVIGQGIFIQQSAKNSHFSGSILIAKTLDSYGNPLSTLGAPSFSWHSGAGSLTSPSLDYDSCHMSNFTALPDYVKIVSHELPY